MKVRLSFVSNSSSSSFVIGKCYMTPKQIEEFGIMLARWSDEKDEDGISKMEETYINETKYYFLGEISMHNTCVYEWITKNSLNEFAEESC